MKQTKQLTVMDVTLGLEPDKETVGLCFNTHALLLLEEELGGPITDVETLMENGGIKQVVSLVRIALEGWRRRVKRTRDEFTLVDAADVLDNLGGLEAAAGLIVELFNGAFPEASRQQAEEEAKKKQEGGPEAPATDPTE